MQAPYPLVRSSFSRPNPLRWASVWFAPGMRRGEKILRCAQNDIFPCHPERSEGSALQSVRERPEKILRRFAPQNDKGGRSGTEKRFFAAGLRFGLDKERGDGRNLKQQGINCLSLSVITDNTNGPAHSEMIGFYVQWLPPLRFFSFSGPSSGGFGFSSFPIMAPISSGRKRSRRINAPAEMAT